MVLATLTAFGILLVVLTFCYVFQKNTLLSVFGLFKSLALLDKLGAFSFTQGLDVMRWEY